MVYWVTSYFNTYKSIFQCIPPPQMRSYCIHTLLILLFAIYMKMLIVSILNCLGFESSHSNSEMLVRGLIWVIFKFCWFWGCVTPFTHYIGGINSSTCESLNWKYVHVCFLKIALFNFICCELSVFQLINFAFIFWFY